MHQCNYFSNTEGKKSGLFDHLKQLVNNHRSATVVSKCARCLILLEDVYVTYSYIRDK